MQFENNKGFVGCILCPGINGTGSLNDKKRCLAVQHQFNIGVSCNPLKADKQVVRT